MAKQTKTSEDRKKQAVKRLFVKEAREACEARLVPPRSPKLARQGNYAEI